MLKVETVLGNFCKKIECKDLCEINKGVDVVSAAWPH